MLALAAWLAGVMGMNFRVDGFWAAVSEFKRLQTDNGRLQQRRQQQSLAWMWERGSQA